MVGFSGGKLSAHDLMVLMAISGLGEEAYGISIRDHVLSRTGTELSVGSVYACLERLETNGFIEGRDGPPIAERGGRRKRFFRVTGLGAKKQREELRVIDQLRVGGAVVT